MSRAERLLFTVNPVISGDWEVVFSDDSLGLVSMLASEIVLPTKSKDVRTFRGGHVHYKQTTTESTGDMEITFIMERTSKVLEYLNAWYASETKKTLKAYLIETLQVITTIPLTNRLAEWKMTGVQINRLGGLRLVQGQANIATLQASFSVDSCVYRKV